MRRLTLKTLYLSGQLWYSKKSGVGPIIADRTKTTFSNQLRAIAIKEGDLFRGLNQIRIFFAIMRNYALFGDKYQRAAFSA
jgi:hypothetical protein